ncbi:MAG: hypothetical protein M1828_005490 [Chrysothrix sp. TS-e1954]|nr:MAG: hypothetical protein M1828_005490 [Chrysothrix sp. TS-e1954]
MSSTSDVEALLKQLESIQYDTLSNDVQRRQVTRAARELANKVEPPNDKINRMTWIELSDMVASKMALDMGLYTKLNANGGKPKTAEQLANACNVPVDTTTRIARHLGTTQLIKEIDANTYEATPTSKALEKPEVFAGLDYIFNVMMPGYINFPMYMAKNKYNLPSDPTNAVWQYSTNSKGSTHFEWLNDPSHKEQLTTFTNLMSGYTMDRPAWFEFYPIEERLLKDFTGDVLLVDVGGGAAHDMRKFHAQFPNAKGKLICQDQEQVISTVSPEPPVYAEVNDFFKAQPIKGAKAYYMHSVLHDWPDAQCKTILDNLASAMTKGYSKVLANESVVGNHKPHPQSTALDLTMMSFLAAKERTTSDFEELLAGSGLKLTGVYTMPGAVEGIVEAELA